MKKLKEIINNINEQWDVDMDPIDGFDEEKEKQWIGKTITWSTKVKKIFGNIPNMSGPGDPHHSYFKNLKQDVTVEFENGDSVNWIMTSLDDTIKLKSDGKIKIFKDDLSGYESDTLIGLLIKFYIKNK